MLTHYRFGEDSDFLRDLKKAWDARLKEAFHLLPPLRLDDQPQASFESEIAY
jgi:putative proteasome-type protease